MHTYILYTYDYCPIDAVQGNLFDPQYVKNDFTTADKNLWLDRIFGDGNTIEEMGQVPVTN